MLFTAEFTIPANTTQASPATQDLIISQGVITEFMIYPRPGHAGLAHMVIRYHEHQIAPSTEGMNLTGDTYPIDWDDYLEIDQPPYELKLEGWNTDDTFEHTFYVAVAILPKALTLAAILASSVKSLFSLSTVKRIFGGNS